MTQSHNQSRPVRFADSWASVLYDLIRGLAAFVVLFGHWRNLFFIDFPQVTKHRALLAVFYVLTGAGHQAVVVFFLLSGYFIGGAVFRAVEHNQWDWAAYLLRRGIRLWMVLVPALLLCLFWDKLGIHLGHAPALYAGNVQNHMISNVAPRLATHIFFGNLFFLQNIVTPVFGSDGALWSLANEFWYYLLFPLAVVALWQRASTAHRLLAASLFLLIAWFVRGGILADFPIWLAGVALFKLPPPRILQPLGKHLCLCATFLYLPVFFSLGKIQAIPSLLSDYLLSVVTFVFLWLLLSSGERFPPHARRVHVARELARFSYTLYAVHIPFLLLIVSLILGDARWSPTLLHLAAGLGLLIAAMLYAYGLAFLTEFRTDALRHRIEGYIHLRSTAPVLPSNPLSQ